MVYWVDLIELTRSRIHLACFCERSNEHVGAKREGYFFTILIMFRFTWKVQDHRFVI
jgi:hypothetical protein